MHGKSAQNRVCAVECLPTLAETMGVVMGSELVEVQNGDSQAGADHNGK